MHADKMAEAQVALLAGAPLAGLHGVTIQVGEHRVRVPQAGAQVCVPAEVADRLCQQAGWSLAPAAPKSKRGREERS